MGTRNRERRRAKQRRDDRRHHQQQSGSRAWTPADPDPVTLARGLVLEAARGGGEDPMFRALDGLLLIGKTVGPAVVEAAVAWCAGQVLESLWKHGWEPAEVARVLARQGGSGAVAALAAELRASAGRRPESHDGGPWAAQVAALPTASRRGLWVEALADGVLGIGVLVRLPALPRLRQRVQRRRPAGDTAKLEQVRALLAKAESTTFPEEAEALTAKAQELMARHAIDRAMLDAASPGERAAVTSTRVWIDDPYAGPKALLLSGIAGANRCRSVWSKELGFSTVVGVDTDVEIVEVLFTSLLVQATEGMVRAGKAAGRRVRSFRQSFLIAFADRIGERLASVAEAVVAEEATHRAGLLPVLAGREEEVEDAVRETFGPLLSQGMSVNNGDGYVAGRAAADLARLAVGEELVK